MNRPDTLTFSIFFHSIAEAKQSSFNAYIFEPGREPGQSAFEPGHLTWRILV
jgi:hypothetical protein